MECIVDHHHQVSIHLHNFISKFKVFIIANFTNLSKILIIGGPRKGLTYGPITSSIDDKKAKRRTYQTSITTSNVMRPLVGDYLVQDALSSKFQYFLNKNSYIMIYLYSK